MKLRKANDTNTITKPVMLPPVSPRTVLAILHPFPAWASL
jgi:hypothetical protein